tara:strand:- start:78 stop:527 length:450 start_codon:yes stop_codon:yes gene_type:complete
MRAPFQVLVLPFHRDSSGDYLFCALKRSDANVWQGIAGGGHEGETPIIAAAREAHEESGIPEGSQIYPLDSKTSIPRNHFKASSEWDNSFYVVKEHSFAVESPDLQILLSDEHTEVKWGTFEEIGRLFTWDSNRTALWELHQRLKDGRI